MSEISGEQPKGPPPEEGDKKGKQPEKGRDEKATPQPASEQKGTERETVDELRDISEQAATPPRDAADNESSEQQATDSFDASVTGIKTRLDEMRQKSSDELKTLAEEGNILAKRILSEQQAAPAPTPPMAPEAVPALPPETNETVNEPPPGSYQSELMRGARYAAERAILEKAGAMSAQGPKREATEAERAQAKKIGENALTAYQKVHEANPTWDDEDRDTKKMDQKALGKYQRRAAALGGLIAVLDPDQQWLLFSKPQSRAQRNQDLIDTLTDDQKVLFDRWATQNGEQKIGITKKIRDAFAERRGNRLRALTDSPQSTSSERRKGKELIPQGKEKERIDGIIRETIAKTTEAQEEDTPADKFTNHLADELKALVYESYPRMHKVLTRESKNMEGWLGEAQIKLTIQEAQEILIRRAQGLTKDEIQDFASIVPALDKALREDPNGPAKVLKDSLNPPHGATPQVEEYFDREKEAATALLSKAKELNLGTGPLPRFREPLHETTPDFSRQAERRSMLSAETRQFTESLTDESRDRLQKSNEAYAAFQAATDPTQKEALQDTYEEAKYSYEQGLFTDNPENLRTHLLLTSRATELDAQERASAEPGGYDPNGVLNPGTEAYEIYVQSQFQQLLTDFSPEAFYAYAQTTLSTGQDKIEAFDNLRDILQAKGNEAVLRQFVSYQQNAREHEEAYAQKQASAPPPAAETPAPQPAAEAAQPDSAEPEAVLQTEAETGEVEPQSSVIARDTEPERDPAIVTPPPPPPLPPLPTGESEPEGEDNGDNVESSQELVSAPSPEETTEGEVTGTEAAQASQASETVSATERMTKENELNADWDEFAQTLANDELRDKLAAYRGDTRNRVALEELQDALGDVKHTGDSYKLELRQEILWAEKDGIAVGENPEPGSAEYNLKILQERLGILNQLSQEQFGLLIGASDEAFTNKLRTENPELLAKFEKHFENVANHEEAESLLADARKEYAFGRDVVQKLIDLHAEGQARTLVIEQLQRYVSQVESTHGPLPDDPKVGTDAYNNKMIQRNLELYKKLSPEQFSLLFATSTGSPEERNEKVAELNTSLASDTDLLNEWQQLQKDSSLNTDVKVLNQAWDAFAINFVGTRWRQALEGARDDNGEVNIDKLEDLIATLVDDGQKEKARGLFRLTLRQEKIEERVAGANPEENPKPGSEAEYLKILQGISDFTDELSNKQLNLYIAANYGSDQEASRTAFLASLDEPLKQTYEGLNQALQHHEEAEVPAQQPTPLPAAPPPASPATPEEPAMPEPVREETNLDLTKNADILAFVQDKETEAKLAREQLKDDPARAEKRVYDERGKAVENTEISTIIDNANGDEAQIRQRLAGKGLYYGKADDQVLQQELSSSKLRRAIENGNRDFLKGELSHEISLLEKNPQEKEKAALERAQKIKTDIDNQEAAEKEKQAQADAVHIIAQQRVTEPEPTISRPSSGDNGEQLAFDAEQARLTDDEYLDQQIERYKKILKEAKARKKSGEEKLLEGKFYRVDIDGAIVRPLKKDELDAVAELLRYTGAPQDEETFDKALDARAIIRVSPVQDATDELDKLKAIRKAAQEGNREPLEQRRKADEEALEASLKGNKEKTEEKKRRKFNPGDLMKKLLSVTGKKKPAAPQPGPSEAPKSKSEAGKEQTPQSEPVVKVLPDEVKKYIADQIAEHNKTNTPANNEAAEKLQNMLDSDDAAQIAKQLREELKEIIDQRLPRFDQIIREGSSYKADYVKQRDEYQAKADELQHLLDTLSKKKNPKLEGELLDEREAMDAKWDKLAAKMPEELKQLLQDTRDVDGYLTSDATKRLMESLIKQNLFGEARKVYFLGLAEQIFDLKRQGVKLVDDPKPGTDEYELKRAQELDKIVKNIPKKLFPQFIASKYGPAEEREATSKAFTEALEKANPELSEKLKAYEQKESEDAEKSNSEKFLERWRGKEGFKAKAGFLKSYSGVRRRQAMDYVKNTKTGKVIVTSVATPVAIGLGFLALKGIQMEHLFDAPLPSTGGLHPDIIQPPTNGAPPPEPAPLPIPEPAPPQSSVAQELHTEFDGFDHTAEPGDSRWKIMKNFVRDHADKFQGGDWKNPQNGVTKGDVLADMWSKFTQRHGGNPNHLSVGEMVSSDDFEKLTTNEQQVFLDAAKSTSADDYIHRVMPEFHHVMESPVDASPVDNHPVEVTHQPEAHLGDHDRQVTLHLPDAPDATIDIPPGTTPDQLHGIITDYVQHHLPPNMPKHLGEYMVTSEIKNGLTEQGVHVDLSLPDFDPQEIMGELEQIDNNLSDLLKTQTVTIPPGGNLWDSLQTQLSGLDTFRGWSKSAKPTLSQIIIDMIADNSRANGGNPDSLAPGTYTLSDLGVQPDQIGKFALQAIAQDSPTSYAKNVMPAYVDAKNNW